MLDITEPDFKGDVYTEGGGISNAYMRYLTQKTGLGVRWEDLTPAQQEKFRSDVAETYSEENVTAAVLAAYKELYGPHPIPDGGHRLVSFLETLKSRRSRGAATWGKNGYTLIGPDGEVHQW